MSAKIPEGVSFLDGRKTFPASSRDPEILSVPIQDQPGIFHHRFVVFSMYEMSQLLSFMETFHPGIRQQLPWMPRRNGESVDFLSPGSSLDLGVRLLHTEQTMKTKAKTKTSGAEDPESVETREYIQGEDSQFPGLLFRFGRFCIISEGSTLQRIS